MKCNDNKCQSRRLTPQIAGDIFLYLGIPEGRDFDTLTGSEVGLVIKAADMHGYRKPVNANGSKGRYFYAYLNRVFKGGNY